MNECMQFASITVFTQINAAAFIIFTTHLGEAFIGGRRLLEGGVNYGIHIEQNRNSNKHVCSIAS